MYEDITYEGILKRMLARVPNTVDKREGSVIWDTHSPAAMELRLLYIELDAVLREAYGDTASREFLILRCREKGIIPYPATKAVLKGEFAPADIDVSGKRFNIGSLNYTVMEKLADGVYQVQCETAGVAGNQHFGAITPIDYISGLQTARLTELLIPGEDEEGTEELRERYLNSSDGKAFGGNIKDYLEKTNAIPGVGGTKVKRAWNGGISPADMIPEESVGAWYDGIKGTLAGEVRKWLDAVYCAAKEKLLTVGGTVCLTIVGSDFGVASDALVRTVQEAIDPEADGGEGYGLAPIGHVVSVKGAAAVVVEINTTLTFDTGYGWDNLQGALDTAISDYLLELRRAWADSSGLTVRVSQVDTRLLSVKGVVDVQGTLINGSRDNLVLGEYEIPVLGGVSR